MDFGRIVVEANTLVVAVWVLRSGFLHNVVWRVARTGGRARLGLCALLFLHVMDGAIVLCTGHGCGRSTLGHTRIHVCQCIVLRGGGRLFPLISSSANARPSSVYTATREENNTTHNPGRAPHRQTTARLADGDGHLARRHAHRLLIRPPNRADRTNTHTMPPSTTPPPPPAARSSVPTPTPPRPAPLAPPWTSRLASVLALTATGAISRAFLTLANTLEVHGLDGFLDLLEEREYVPGRSRGLITISNHLSV